MRQGHINRSRLLRSSAHSALLILSLIAPCVVLGQLIPGLQPPKSSRPGGGTSEMSAEDIFKHFAGRILFLTCDESADEYSQASGVLVSADGLILTNAHVVERCRSMKATYISGKTRQSYDPLLKYYDEKSDIAVLKIDAQGLDFFSLLSRPVRIGERVYAIGNPRGLEQSISEGIVSGDREEDGTSWIQHSAPISPGSSGGALISSRGELLGINSWARRESQNLNFAVPAATLTKVYSTAKSVPGFLDFPLNAETTGTYSGVVQNLASGLSADFTISVRGTKGGAMEGCMAVKLPLVGGGYLRGKADGLKLSFVVTGDLTQIHFDGQRDANNLSGNYLASNLDGGSGQKGTFLLHKVSSEGLGSGFDILNCPSDVALIRQAAEQKNAEAQLRLGILYSEGRGVPQDFAQASALFRKAAEQGNAEAQATLGATYELGRGVPQSYSEAALWYLKAAGQGYAHAQIFLGYLYEAGHGVSQGLRSSVRVVSQSG
jgi:S1-C subfamily serine protease